MKQAPQETNSERQNSKKHNDSKPQFTNNWNTQNLTRKVQRN
nr:hypothetical protein [Mycoplasmopsis bovis]